MTASSSASSGSTAKPTRTARWKYSVYAPDLHGWQVGGSDRYDEEYLYDLQADPYELTNLIGIEAFRAVADDLRERLIRRMVPAGEAAPDIEPAAPRPGGQRSPKLPPYPSGGADAGSHGQRTH